MCSRVRKAEQQGQVLLVCMCVVMQPWQKEWPQLVTNGSEIRDMHTGQARSSSPSPAGRKPATPGASAPPPPLAPSPETLESWRCIGCWSPAMPLADAANP